MKRSNYKQTANTQRDWLLGISERNRPLRIGFCSLLAHYTYNTLSDPYGLQIVVISSFQDIYPGSLPNPEEIVSYRWT